MQKKVFKIVLFAIFCSIFSNIFSDNLVSRALDLARNIQSPGASGGTSSGQQSDSKPGRKVVIPFTNVTYDMNNTELKELNIGINNKPLTFVALPDTTKYKYFKDTKLISNLSFIPQGTEEFTIIIKAYDSSDKPLDTSKDLRAAINNYNFEELYKVIIANKNGNQIGSEIELPIQISLELTDMLYAGDFDSNLGINSTFVNADPFSYPISLTLKNIKNWQPGSASGKYLIGKNLSEFKKALGITADEILISGSKPKKDGSMPEFNINIPTPTGKSRYAFVKNPWGSTGRIQTVSNDGESGIGQNKWNEIANLIKSGGYMSLVAFDKQYNYIAKPWNNTPVQYSLFLFDSDGNPVGLLNYKGQAIEPITFKAGMYNTSSNPDDTPSVLKPSSSNPILFGGLNSSQITNITTYPFVLKFWNN